MRLFTAIDLPEDVCQRLDGLIGRLRPLAPISWSKAANLHITTKFIGQWPEGSLPELRKALALVGQGHALPWSGHGPAPHTIPIRVRGLGFFPNAKSPRVFWAGVEAPPELAILARDIDSALAKLGIEPESRA